MSREVGAERTKQEGKKKGEAEKETGRTKDKKGRKG